MTASRGQLLSGSPHRGTAVHAASFIRSRRIVIESRLLRYRRLLRLIVIHELFHFVWARLSNRKRIEYDHLLQQEFSAGARGELGESSDVKKAARASPGTPAWRDYVCESFCDTAAFVYSRTPRHRAFTLAAPWRARRRQWFETNLGPGCRC